ncbi:MULTISPECIES: Na+/H+ antiporter NhaC family protein [Pontibacillus]|uniref:Na+/H+ antiporter NhaC family protein n=1 Tax=Pontibacillus chungwhensis TaxID=265426 RepID=A0ABY8UVT4_9BACI|nr:MULTISPECIES: Na+/H+ antiporter NhaC family protein [Pontibacillus]MCD5325170.1 Na+/H+ antiporter NhaC family protein [Pontibacillus sp. HN14]WIF97418.1 Na+/H+ antiporter NhaC family protein [Pontibacillus chungwhensis]
MEGTIYSLIPPLVMLVLVLVTRRVLISLGVGILLGAFMLHDFSLSATLSEVWKQFYTIFYVDGALNLGNLFLLSFLLLLGITTAFMTASGGSRAFGEWAIQRVKTRKGAQAMPAVLGIIIFIDDYFNSLAIGSVARPLTDRYKVSRAKLAYLIDSTSAPITVISPISSWGAYIIGTIGTIIATNELTQFSGLEAFVKMIPMNLYVFAAILLVFLTIYRKFDIGAMKKHEQKAEYNGELVDQSKDVPGDLNNEFKDVQSGRVYHLIVPIIVLILATIVAMVITGIQGTEGNVTILEIFKNTNVNRSLFAGGLFAALSGFVLYVAQPGDKSSLGKVGLEGSKAMLPAIYILVFAWMIGAIIGELETGEFLANQFESLNINPSYLPLLVFLVSGGMAFSTGTSWGTFGIMLPIAGNIAANTDVSMFLPALAAVLAGSVFGDHCSPISDTSILSSTGAGSNHIDHVMTQLPYALISAGATAVGYMVYGMTSSAFLSLVITLLLVVLIVFAVNPKGKPSEVNESKTA